MQITTVEDIARDFPTQQLKFFRDRTTQELVRFKRIKGIRYNVFYLAADGHQFCWHCANQEDAEPPIVAGQVNGDKATDVLRQCDGCGASIYPLKLIDLNRNHAALHVVNDRGEETVIGISFETPVAVYDFMADTFHRSDIAWSRSTEQHISEIDWHIREILAERLGFKNRYDVPCHYWPPQYIKQEELDDHLKLYLGSTRLPSGRDPKSYGHQPLINTVRDYDRIRKELAEATTDKVVVKPQRNRGRRIFL